MDDSRIFKPWGWEEIVEQNEHYVVKKLFMKKGERCSYQYHKNKIETIVVLSGTLDIALGFAHDCVTHRYDSWQTCTILNNAAHRMYGVTDCLYLECSTPELDDVVRIEDDYGRIE